MKGLLQGRVDTGLCVKFVAVSSEISHCMHYAGESSEPTQAGEAVAPLRGLLELFRLTRRQPTLDETLVSMPAAASHAAQGV